MRQAFAGMLWSKQFYNYDVATWLDGDPAQPAPPRGAGAEPQRALAELRRLRHPVDAGQVGVPLVRRLGPGLPLRLAGPRRPRVRQVPAGAAVPGVVPAPERGAARLRVGLLRRQPAGPGLGGARGVRARRGQGPRLPRPDLRQAAGQLHLVGEQGRRLGQQPVRGRLPRPRQHRPDRPVAPAAGHGPRAVRRHRLDGLLRAVDGHDRAHPLAQRPPGTAPTWCSSSSSTTPASRRRSRPRGCGTTPTGCSTTTSAWPAARSSRSRPGPWSG